MLDRLAQLLQVSTPVAAMLLVLIVVQVGLLVYCLVDLARREKVRNAPKWLWALVIVLGNLPGSIAYLVAGRSEPTVDVPGGTRQAGSDAAARAVDTLYGPDGPR